MKPVLQALVLADRIYEDKSSGKKIIAGTFNQIMFGRVNLVETDLPDGTKAKMIPGGMDIGCPAVYISLTDVVDGTEITLQFANISKNEVMFQTGFRIDKVDRLATVELIACLPPITGFVKEAGTFTFDVVWKGEILGSHRVQVVEITNPGEGG